MSLEITTHKEYDTGTIYKFNGKAVFVPAGVTDQVGVDLEDDHEAVRAADGLHRETPGSVVVFENNGRSATDRAELWAAIHELPSVEKSLVWRADIPDETSRIRIPVIVAAEGTAAMATFLACYGFSNSEIGDALDVGSRTVSQYISDFRKGER
jgi:DNA-directed RNA polymerase specialized sigma24 family protein